MVTPPQDGQICTAIFFAFFCDLLLPTFDFESRFLGTIVFH